MSLIFLKRSKPQMLSSLVPTQVISLDSDQRITFNDALNKTFVLVGCWTHLPSGSAPQVEVNLVKQWTSHNFILPDSWGRLGYHIVTSTSASITLALSSTEFGPGLVACFDKSFSIGAPNRINHPNPSAQVTVNGLNLMVLFGAASLGGTPSLSASTQTVPNVIVGSSTKNGRSVALAITDGPQVSVQNSLVVNNGALGNITTSHNSVQFN